MIVPSFGDQFFWGWRVQELGVGPKPIPRNKLTLEKLVSAIQQTVNDDNIRKNASSVGQKIRDENGVETAVRLIEDFTQFGHL